MPVILATWEGEIGKITVQDWHEQIVSETPSQQTRWVWLCYTPVILAMQETEAGGW
jgi:hypothetical protein